MPPARPPTLARAAGALLGMTAATCTPGLLFVAQAIDASRGPLLATAFHVLLASWGGLAGALVVRERFEGRSRSWLWLVPLYSLLYLATGLVYTLIESARGGQQAFGAFVLLGGLTLLLVGASVILGSASYWLVRRLATGLRADLLDADSERRLAQRAARYLVIAGAAQLATGVFGGPLITGAIASLGAIWFFCKARPLAKWSLGALLAACFALVAAGTQASLWASQVDDLERAALPPCADSDSEPMMSGAYTQKARSVSGVSDAQALLRLDPAQSPNVVYRVFVTVRAREGAAPVDVQRTVEHALRPVGCDEGPQLRKVPFVVRVLGPNASFDAG